MFCVICNGNDTYLSMIPVSAIASQYVTVLIYSCVCFFALLRSVSSTYHSDGLLERGKRQKAPLVSSADEMDAEDHEEMLSNEIRAATAGQTSKYEMVLKRDKIRKEFRLNETGRKITLSLLAKGVDPGPGNIVHITPDLLESGEMDPMQTDQGIDDLWTDADDAAMSATRRGKSSGGSKMSDAEKAAIAKAEEDMLGGMMDDNDPELDAFLKAIQGAGDGDNISFDDFLKNVDTSALDENDAMDGDERGFLGSSDNHKRGRGVLGGSRGESGEENGDASNPMDNLLGGMGDHHDNKFEELSRRMKDDLPEDKLRLIDELEDDIKSGRFDVENLDFDTLSRYKESADIPADDDFTPRSEDDDAVSRKRITVMRPPAVRRNPLIAMLDNEPLPEPSPNDTPSAESLAALGRDEKGVITRDEVDRQWNQVLFGRCPDPDYSEPMHVRRDKNCTRADGLYNDMMEQGIQPNRETLTRYMSVHSECGRLQGALDIIDKMSAQHDLLPDEETYHRLIRGHIFIKDIDGALGRLSEMKERNLRADREVYGILINSLSHRDRLVEALQLLETAAAEGLKIQNCHIKKLRARCAKLGVEHPDIYPDPNEWVKEVKERRKKSKNFPVGNKVHFARSLTFT